MQRTRNSRQQCKYTINQKIHRTTGLGVIQEIHEGKTVKIGSGQDSTLLVPRQNSNSPGINIEAKNKS